MGLRRALTVLAEQWEDVRIRLKTNQSGELAALVADFVDEGDPGTSADIAEQIMDRLTEWLPVKHPVIQALLEPADRFQDTTRRASDLGAWFRLAEPLRVRLGVSAPTADEVMLEGSERLLAADALSADELRTRGQNPEDPGLICLERPDGTQQWPAFQFEPDGAVWIVVRAINRILGAEEDPFGVADWWLGENGWLGDAPARLIGNIPDDELITVARAEEAAAEA